MSTESVTPSNHLILRRPLPLPSIFPSIRFFSFQMCHFFTLDGPSIGASASVLPMNILGCWGHSWGEIDQNVTRDPQDHPDLSDPDSYRFSGCPRVSGCRDLILGPRSLTHEDLVKAGLERDCRLSTWQKQGQFAECQWPNQTQCC